MREFVRSTPQRNQCPAIFTFDRCPIQKMYVRGRAFDRVEQKITRSRLLEKFRGKPRTQRCNPRTACAGLSMSGTMPSSRQPSAWGGDYIAKDTSSEGHSAGMWALSWQRRPNLEFFDGFLPAQTVLGQGTLPQAALTPSHVLKAAEASGMTIGSACIRSLQTNGRWNGRFRFERRMLCYIYIYIFFFFFKVSIYSCIHLPTHFSVCVFFHL